jgi:hypothetical protein
MGFYFLEFDLANCHMFSLGFSYCDQPFKFGYHIECLPHLVRIPFTSIWSSTF